MARGSKKIGPLFPIGGTPEPEKKIKETEAKQQPETSSKLDEKPEVQTKEIETEKVSEPPATVEDSGKAATQQVQEQPIPEWQREPEVEIQAPVEVRNQQPEPEPKKDHSPMAQEESDQKGKELLKFEQALREYEEELEIRPKKELVTNVPIPLPNPVYQKLKDLEPYFTLKQKGFIQKVITDATIKEVKRLIQEVETKKLKKLRK